MAFLTRWLKSTWPLHRITTLLLHLRREEMPGVVVAGWRTSNKSCNRNRKRHRSNLNKFKMYNKVSKFRLYVRVYRVSIITILIVVAADLRLQPTWQNSKLCYKNMLVNCSTKMRRCHSRRPRSWLYNIWWSDIIIRKKASRPMTIFIAQTLIHTTMWPLQSWCNCKLGLSPDSTPNWMRSKLPLCSR